MYTVSKWPNRDPIREIFSRNLLSFINNDPVNLIDLLGLFPGSDINLSEAYLNAYGGHDNGGVNQDHIDLFVETTHTIAEETGSTLEFVANQIVGAIAGAILDGIGVSGILNTVLGMLLNPTPIDSTWNTHCNLSSSNSSSCGDPNDPCPVIGPVPMITCSYNCVVTKGLEVVDRFTEVKYVSCSGSCP